MRKPKAPKLEVVTDAPDRAMVIFAHPDDAELGSGGVVARWVAAGCEVTYVLCTNGGAGTADRALTPDQLTERRETEQRAAADFMGVKHVVMLGYPVNLELNPYAPLAEAAREMSLASRSLSYPPPPACGRRPFQGSDQAPASA